MKPIYNKTGLENLLELIKKDNPGAVITADQVTLDTLTTDGGTGRTSTTLTAVLDNGYSGNITVDWVRRQLNDYAPDSTYVVTDGTETEESLKELIASTLNLVSSDIQWGTLNIPQLDDNQIYILDLTSITGVVYDGVETTSIYISTVDLSEDTRGSDDIGVRITSGGNVRKTVFIAPIIVTTVGIFNGGSGGGFFDYLTGITESGAQAFAQSRTGIDRDGTAGVSIGGAAMFFGDQLSANVDIFAPNGVKTSTATATGAYIRRRLAGTHCGGNGMFYGSQGAGGKLDIISPTGTLVAPTTTLGTGRYYLDGVTLNGLAFYYGGYTDTNKTTTFDSAGAMVGPEVTLAYGTYAHAGANSGQHGIFFAGDPIVATGRVVRFDSNRDVVSADTSISFGRNTHAGATVGATAVFFGGYNAAALNTVTRINESGTQVGSNTNIGTARRSPGGAGA